MGNILFAPSLLWVLIAAGSSSAVADDETYNALLYRASLRDLEEPVPPKRSGKFTTAHEDLIMDIVQTCNGRESLSRQRELFNRLVSQQGMVEMSQTAFNQRAGAARRKLGEQSSRRIPTVGVEVSELLASIFNEDPTITGKGALKALKQRMGDRECALPSIIDVVNWLRYRISLLRLSSEEKSAKATCSGNKNEDQDFWEELKASLAEDSEELLVSEESISCSHQQGPRQVVEKTAKIKDKRDIFGSTFAGTEAYLKLLTGARERTTNRASLKGTQKFTAEHDSLIMDVVRSFDQDVSLSKQFEVFKRLTQDLEMREMSRSTFEARAGAFRSQIMAGNRRPASRKPAVGEEASNILTALFQNDRKITVKNAFQALKSELGGAKDRPPLPSIRDVAQWIKYRRSRMRFSAVPHEVRRAEQDDDAEFWNETILALADHEDIGSSSEGLTSSGEDQQF